MKGAILGRNRRIEKKKSAPLEYRSSNKQKQAVGIPEKISHNPTACFRLTRLPAFYHTAFKEFERFLVNLLGLPRFYKGFDRFIVFIVFSRNN